MQLNPPFLENVCLELFLSASNQAHPRYRMVSFNATIMVVCFGDLPFKMHCVGVVSYNDAPVVFYVHHRKSKMKPENDGLVEEEVSYGNHVQVPW